MKEVENFIQAEFADYNPEMAFQKALGTVLPVRGQSIVVYVFETEGYVLNDVLLTVYTVQI